MTDLTVAQTSIQGTILQALRGLLQNAVRAGATNIRVELHPQRTVVGHNGKAPGSLDELFQVAGEPRDGCLAEQDLQALLNPEWCTQIRVSTGTATAFVDPSTKESLWIPETGTPAMEGTWWDIRGDNVVVSASWLQRCVGFTDVDLQMGEHLLPAPTQGSVVLSCALFDLHLYGPESGFSGDDRNLNLGWSLIHIGSEHVRLSTELCDRARQVLTERDHPDLAQLELRMHVVLTGQGQRELLSPADGPIPGHLNEKRLLQELKGLLGEFPTRLVNLLEGVLAQMTEGISQFKVRELCGKHNVPLPWLEAELLRQGWRSCPEVFLHPLSDIPQSWETWHQQYQSSNDLQAVLCNNLIRHFGEPGLPAALALPEDGITLQPSELPIYLCSEGIKITAPEKVREWMQDSHQHMELLVLVHGLVVSPEDDQFFSEEPNLSRADFLLNLVLDTAL